MASNLPGSAVGNVGPSGFFNRVLTAGSFGLALHYAQIQKSWQTCGTDIFCKSEKLILYMLAIFGASSPSVLLSQIVKNYVNKISVIFNGNPLFDQDSFWGPTVISMGIYTGLEYYLSSWWEWISYATDCLKLGICENDDILVWIHNMKIRYCSKTYVDMDSTQLDCVDGDCIEGKAENVTMSEIKDPSDWCVIFFNELPLLVSAASIGMIYALSSSTDFQSGLPTTTDPGGQPETGDGTKENTEGSSDKDGKSEGSDKSGSTDKGDKVPDKPPTRPSSSRKSVVGNGERNTRKGSSCMTQIIQVTCPICKKSKSVHIPKPLPIYCENCGNIAASKCKSSATPTPIFNDTAGNNDVSGKYLSSTSTIFKNPNSGVLREDKVEPSVTWLNQCDPTAEDSERDYDKDDFDYIELYREYKALVQEILRDMQPCGENSEQLNATDTGNKQADEMGESRRSRNAANISREQLDWEHDVDRENALDYA